jgi:hypothetical protein
MRNMLRKDDKAVSGMVIAILTVAGVVIATVLYLIQNGTL